MPRGWCQIFSMVPRDRTRRSGHKLTHKKFHHNTKNFFMLRVTKYWNR